MIEIYGLYDPETDALRYVGKAKDSQARLKRHISERNINRPVCRWVGSLVNRGLLPVARVLETVPDAEWENAERRLIAHYRQSCELLNLADGGAMPSQTIEQRRKAARTSLKAQATKTAAEVEFIRAKQNMARLLARFMKDGAKTGKYFHAYSMRFFMRAYYAADPARHTSWAHL